MVSINHDSSANKDSQQQITTLFPENNFLLTKKTSSTLLLYDSHSSAISGSESIRSKTRKKKKKANISSSYVNPTDIFARNLSDAVMDADDSDDLESYVYRDHYYSSTGTESNTDGYTEHRLLPSRRPILRSTVSEIPRPLSNTNLRPSLRYHYLSAPYHQLSDEEFTPLVVKRSRTPRRRNNYNSNSTFLYVIIGCIASFFLLSLLLVFYASPLSDVEVVGINTVLGTQKELIFNLQVKARNSNWWTIRITNTVFSVFASSHYVPTALSIPSQTNITTQGADPAEFLGTIYFLEDPLIYPSGGLFDSLVTTATSQIQIKNPGSTKEDSSGNERWSLLIRYPYELTIRGVLKYQVLPSFLTQPYSVRVCKMSRIDPATSKVSFVIPERSICDDPSMVEDSS